MPLKMLFRNFNCYAGYAANQLQPNLKNTCKHVKLIKHLKHICNEFLKRTITNNLKILNRPISDSIQFERLQIEVHICCNCKISRKENYSNSTIIVTMANVGGNVANTFRTKFHMIDKDLLRWFPGHMDKGVKKMQKTLKNVDCIIEVHDARIPISGRYADYSRTLTGLKPHILVLNKKDLYDEKYNESVVSRLKEEGMSNIIFTNFKDQACSGMKKLLPLAKNLIQNSDRYNRSEESSYAIMIIGVPNVGKSSLINRLRTTHMKKSGNIPVGGIAGITRAVSTHIKISDNPEVYVYDTPGILTPQLKTIHTGLKLALVGCHQDHLIGEELLADYLLFWLNRHNHFEYVEKLGLSEPKDDIMYVLTFIAAKLRKTLRVKDHYNKYVLKPDFKSAASYFITEFRTGRLGLYCLDEDLLEDRK